MSEAGVRPLGDRLYVKRLRAEQSAGGIVLLQDYRAKRSPRLTMAAKADYWPARVLAIGEDVDVATKADLKVGDEILVYTFAEDIGRRRVTGLKAGLYAGDWVNPDHAFIRPDDIVCALEREAGEAFPPPTSFDVDQDPGLSYGGRRKPA